MTNLIINKIFTLSFVEPKNSAIGVEVFGMGTTTPDTLLDFVKVEIEAQLPKILETAHTAYMAHTSQPLVKH